MLFWSSNGKDICKCFRFVIMKTDLYFLGKIFIYIFELFAFNLFLFVFFPITDKASYDNLRVFESLPPVMIGDPSRMHFISFSSFIFFIFVQTSANMTRKREQNESSKYQLNKALKMTYQDVHVRIKITVIQYGTPSVKWNVKKMTDIFFITQLNF